MTVTIHPPRGQRLTDLVRTLIALAGGDRGAVTAGRGGVIVDDALALTYLTRHLPAPDPARMVVPPNLNRLVARVEQAGGLHQPVAAPPVAVTPDTAPASTAQPVPRKRAPRVRQSTARTTPEAVHV